jgi:lipoprotein-anchoring transpeptidase ErfK/SrfK
MGGLTGEAAGLWGGAGGFVRVPAMPNLRILIIVGALATLATATAARADGPSANPPGMKPLSDERTVTRWAYPENHGKIRSRPATQAKTIARLHWLTEDRLPEIYIALASWVDAHGSTWVKIRVPKRPNGITGWVPRSSLRQYTLVRELLDIDRRTLRATLYRSGTPVMSARVGIGTSANPTPAGHFYIREKFRVTTSPVYGPYAMGTSAYAPRLTDWPGGGVVGLHGTNEPSLIPGRPSHGCIRLRNASITRLYRLTPRGTPLNIHD